LAHKNQQEMLALGPSRAQFGGLILRTQTMFCQKGTMTKASFVSVLSFLTALGLSSAASAQARDPLTKFIDNLFKRDAVEQPADQPVEPASPPPEVKRIAEPKKTVRPSRAQQAAPAAAPAAASAPDAAETEQAAVSVSPSLPSPPLPPRRPPETAAAAAPQEAPAAAPKKVASAVQPVGLSQPTSQAVPSSPAAALDRVNAFFNSIDLLTANFSQESATGQRTGGSLYIKHPGQLRFAYAPPSALEIVSDGRSVAVRDKKLGTNDVYSVNQTPLKFLMQDQFNLARDTKLRDVQVRPDGIVMISFEDSATLGGTSKVTLLFDSRANKLKEWTIIDAQGYKTSVALSDVNVVQRAQEAASQ
jgi:outer membrane lipoprotein-sorting protein